MSVIRSFILVLLFALAPTMGCGSSPPIEASSTTTLDQAVVQSLSTQHPNKTFDIERLTTNDAERFVREKLSSSLLNDKPNFTWKELKFGAENFSTLHIGAVTLTYSDHHQLQSAKKQLKGSGFLAQSKILTPYSSKARDNTLLFVYSETFMHPDRERVMQYILKIDALSL